MTLPVDDVSSFVFGKVLVHAHRDKLFQAQLELSPFVVDLEHQRFDGLPDLQHVLGMLNTLPGSNLTDVDHAFDAFGDLNEGAKLGEAGHLPLDHRAQPQTSAPPPRTDRSTAA